MGEKKYGSISPGVRSLSLDKMGKNLLVGTCGSEIYELSIEPSSRQVDQHAKLVNGHCTPRRLVININMLVYRLILRCGDLL